MLTLWYYRGGAAALRDIARKRLSGLRAQREIRRQRMRIRPERMVIPEFDRARAAGSQSI
jgi:hypothetical protein